jgi:hypothetical protein
MRPAGRGRARLPARRSARHRRMPLARALDLAMACVLLVGRQQQAGACDAGVFFGENCTQALAEAHDPACVAWPLNANATSAYSVLQWKKGGAGYGGKDDLGGDVFLSTTLNLGCGGGYFGSQMHWNTSSMNLDWAVWDIVSSISWSSTRAPQLSE